jgi:hypothetical protein
MSCKALTDKEMGKGASISKAGFQKPCRTHTRIAAKTRFFVTCRRKPLLDADFIAF